MRNFEGISFIWALVIVGLIAAIYAARAYFEYAALRRDAASDFEFKTRQGMVAKTISENDYIRAYMRFHAPRGKTHIAAALAAILILTFPGFALIKFLLDQLYLASGKSDVYEPGFFVWQFMIFFGIIAIWAAIVYVAARHYYRHAPVSFERELQKIREG